MKKKIYVYHQNIQNLFFLNFDLIFFHRHIGQRGKGYNIVGHPAEIQDSAGGILYGKIN